MSSSRSKRSKSRKGSSKRGDLRFVKSRGGSRSKGGSRRRSGGKSSTRAKTKRAIGQSPASGDGAAGITPGWEDLLEDNAASSAELKQPGGWLAAMSTARVAVSIIAVAGLVALYVGHIYATQDLLADVQQLRSENLELNLERNRLSSAWDRKTAPAVIYDRAREMGLTENVPSGETVIIR